MNGIDPKVIADICSIPRAFRTSGLSLRELVMRSGYPIVRDAITANALVPHIATNVNIIDDWAAWSEDQRTGEGWYLSRTRAGVTVGLLGPTAQETPYSSAAECCAPYILHVLRGIDDHARA